MFRNACELLSKCRASNSAGNAVVLLPAHAAAVVISAKRSYACLAIMYMPKGERGGGGGVGGGAGRRTVIGIEDADAKSPAVRCAKEEHRIGAGLVEVRAIWLLHQNENYVEEHASQQRTPSSRNEALMPYCSGYTST